MIIESLRAACAAHNQISTYIGSLNGTSIYLGRKQILELRREVMENQLLTEDYIATDNEGMHLFGLPVVEVNQENYARIA